jgi:hypothetical protein
MYLPSGRFVVSQYGGGLPGILASMFGCEHVIAVGKHTNKQSAGANRTSGAMEVLPSRRIAGVGKRSICVGGAERIFHGVRGSERHVFSLRGERNQNAKQKWR